MQDEYANTLTRNIKKQTNKHSSRMRTVRFSGSGGVCPISLLTDPPGRDMGSGTETPEKEHGTRLPWDKAARQEVTTYRDSPWTNKHL